MDHEAMKTALDRAIQDFKLDQCNMCGKPADQNDGEFVDIVLTDKVIRIWECSSCLPKVEDDI